MPKIGDRVRFLNSVGGGVIKRIEGNIAYVDDDGFQTPTLLRELVVVAPAEETARRVAATADAIEAAPPAKTSDTPAQSGPAPQETPEGEKLNVVLAWEPVDSRRLSTAGFDTYLVNDSNYYLYFTYMTRSDLADGWTTRFAGLIEPGMQVFLEQITPEDVASMDRLAVQMIAFKTEREFRLKNPVAIEMPLANDKFFKLHCFGASPYFDADVLAIPLVTDDRPKGRTVVDSSQLEKALKEKKRADRTPGTSRPVRKSQKRGDIIEVDLHISELVDTTAGMSNADMLNLQIDTFRSVMDANLRNKGQKIVFIHGKGEGVLRQALLKELNHRYKGHAVQDASFREYGFGATQVTI